MRMKVAYGNFENSTRGPGTEQVTEFPLSNQGTKVIYAITNRCFVRGIYLFNTTSNECDIQMYDVSGGDSSDAAPAVSAVKTEPLVYRTIVPRDQQFAGTFDITDNFNYSWSMDLYDTPSGIYDEFPKPGFLFEHGVAIYNATPATDGNQLDPLSKLHYVIFYTE